LVETPPSAVWGPPGVDQPASTVAADVMADASRTLRDLADRGARSTLLPHSAQISFWRSSAKSSSSLIAQTLQSIPSVASDGVGCAKSGDDKVP